MPIRSLPGVARGRRGRRDVLKGCTGSDGNARRVADSLAATHEARRVADSLAATHEARRLSASALLGALPAIEQPHRIAKI
jgi:hypothetical protein